MDEKWTTVRYPQAEHQETEGRLGRLREVIDSGGQGVVLICQAVCGVRIGADFHPSPLEQDIGVMALLFGDGCDAVHEVERFLEVGEEENLVEVVVFDYGPGGGGHIVHDTSEAAPRNRAAARLE